MNKLKTIFRSLHWKNILGLTIAGLINAFGITIFLSPVNLYDSGISGTSMLLSQITPEHLSLSVFLIILNIPLFLYGWKKQGSTFTIYAIYVVAIYSLGAWLITDVLPVDVRFVSPLAGSDLLLCALFGGLQIPLRRDPCVGHHQLFLFVDLQQRLAPQPVKQLVGIRRFQQRCQAIFRFIAADPGKYRQQMQIVIAQHQTYAVA